MEITVNHDEGKKNSHILLKKMTSSVLIKTHYEIEEQVFPPISKWQITLQHLVTELMARKEQV